MASQISSLEVHEENKILSAGTSMAQLGPVEIITKGSVADMSVDELRRGRGSADVWRPSPINEHYSTVFGAPTLTLKCGEISADNNIVIVIIPGIPGVAHIYKDFVRQLHTFSRMPVWCISHAGHLVMPPEVPAASCPTDFYNLEGQIKHKYMYLRDHIQDHVRLVLVGHGIGGHIAIELMNRLPKEQILRCILLFPIIDRTETTDGARQTEGTLSYRWSITTAVSLISKCFESVQNYFIDWYFENMKIAPCVRKGFLRMMDSQIISNIMILLHDQLEIDHPDHDTITDNINKMVFFYGTTDAWCPYSYYIEMKERYPKASIIIDTHKVMADFYVKSTASKLLAREVYDWMTESF